MMAKSRILVSLPVVFSLFLWALLPSMTVFSSREIKGESKEECGQEDVSTQKEVEKIYNLCVLKMLKEANDSKEKPKTFVKTVVETINDTKSIFYTSFSGSSKLYLFAKTMEELGKKETNNEVNNTKITSKNCIQGFGNVFGVIPDNK